MIEFVPACPSHIGTIARRMREIDRRECAIMGHTPKQALRASLRASTVAWTAKIDSRPEAMFGATAESLTSGEGSPWLLLTPVAERYAVTLVRAGRVYSDVLQHLFPVLSNRVHADNLTAIRWLSRLGYAIGEVESYGGHSMRTFERRGTPCENRLAC